MPWVRGSKTSEGPWDPLEGLLRQIAGPHSATGVSDATGLGRNLRIPGAHNRPPAGTLHLLRIMRCAAVKGCLEVLTGSIQARLRLHKQDSSMDYYGVSAQPTVPSNGPCHSHIWTTKASPPIQSVKLKGRPMVHKKPPHRPAGPT